ncbi:MAG: ATP-binding protein [Paludibacteraceae bacterium]|nr:ATP-binding protein [Paludibacteraceae bacterium]
MENTFLRKLPIGVQDFESLRNDGYLYVDKTEQIHRLISTGRYYFLSRPRRFGKSMLISTLKALFEGKRELFEGLAIASKPDFKWAKHPVLHLDLNTNKYDRQEVLEQKLGESLSQWELQFECPRPDLPFGMRFENVIKKAYEKTGLRVVILVDEYDKPMLQAIGNPKLQDDFRSILKGFYGALKSMDGCIRFAILTGVTKFGKVSVFSDLNNLRDISMSRKYHDICGITEEELKSVFKPEIEELAEENHLTIDECLAEMRRRYDGYHFETSVQGIYNPFSVLNTFAELKFGSYWFETGTPSYLVYLLQKHDWNLEEMSREKASAEVLNSIDVDSTNPIPVIYQSGYLTIKDYDTRFKTYTLGFPNEEVEEGFTKYLMPCYIYRKDDNKSPFLIDNFVNDVESGNTEQFVKRLRSLFADTPYELVQNLENHYRNVVWLLFKLMGFYTQAEYHTSDGRIDMVVKTPKYCYVLEFKLDGTAEEALAQIQDKNYTLPFAIEDQQIVRIGINFDSKTRNIDKCLVSSHAENS